MDPEIELTPSGKKAAEKSRRLERAKRIQRDKRLGGDTETSETIEQLVDRGLLETWTKDGEAHYRITKEGKSYIESHEELRETITRLTEEGKIELDEDKKDKDKPVVEVDKSDYRYFATRRKGYLHFKHELDIMGDSLKENKNKIRETLNQAQTEVWKDHRWKEGEAVPFRNTLENCKMFDIDDNIVKLLMLTNNEIIENKPMPFEDIFLNCDLNIDGFWYKGIMLSKSEMTDGSIMLMTFTNVDKSDWPCDSVIWYNLKKDASPASTISEKLIKEFDLKWNEGAVPIEKRNYKKLAIFCMNFLDFLNNPDVQVVEFIRSQKNIERRKRKGKEVLPSTRKVIVRGDLKRYMEHISVHLDNFHYTHKFWVRGHYMRFWNREKFHHMYSMLAAGKLHTLNRRHVRKDGSIVSLNYEVDPDGTIKVWKWPYIKGEGILIEKTYEVKK